MSTCKQAEKTRIDGQSWYLLEYSNMADFLHDADLAPECFSPASRRSSPQRDSFTGTSNFEEASKLAREGWEEGLARIAELVERISPIVGRYINDFSTVHDVAGAYVDIGRFVEGEPENMVSFTEEVKRNQGGRIVKITIDVGAACHVSKEDMFRRGAAIIALTDGLEKAGFIAEVDAIQLIRGRTEASKFCLRVPVKKAGEPVEMGRMAYCFAHASMLRRHVFAIEEGQSETFRNAFSITGNYGYPMASIPEALKESGEIAVNGISQGGSQWYSEDTAIAWVVSQLKAQGAIHD